LVVSEQQPITPVQEALVRLCAILTLAALAAVVLPVHATTHNVDVGGGGDFVDIWGALTASVTGDTILVAPGTYTGFQNKGLNPNGKNIVFLAGGDGGIPVTIDCEGAERAFLFESGEGDSTLVRGFTIVNGADIGGGGITASSASPTIEDCTFLDCYSALSGGALFLDMSTSTVSSCVFRGNTAGSSGGAVYAYQTGVTFTGCLFDENTATGGGGALYLNSGSETALLCTFVENNLDQILVYGSDSDVSISNCVIANGTEGRSVGINAAGVAMVTHCVLFGNAGGDTPECEHVDNIYYDPLFCDDTMDDYTLCDDSFAIDYNNMYHEQIGAYESGCPPCDTAVEEVTWGAVKALFR